MSTPAPTLLLDRETVAGLLDLESCITAVEAAFAAHEQGRLLAPGLLHVDGDGGAFHIKAGGLRRERTYFTCKVNGGFFQNSARLGLPNILGLILVCDGSNGTPLAVMESSWVTRLRTGAATAVAAKYLARPDSATATICGAGIQGEIQLLSLAQVLPLRRAFVWSRSGIGPSAKAARFADKMGKELNMDVRVAADLGAAARQSDVIVTCTPATQWFLGRDHVLPGTFIAAVGADSPDKQELEPELLATASVVCDLTEQCARVGDLHHALEAKLMTAGQVRGELGAVIIGKAPRRLEDDEIIVFDSTGTALQDAAAAAAVYQRAITEKRGQPFAFWA